MSPETSPPDRRVPAAFLLRSFVNAECRHERERLLVQCGCARRLAHLFRPEQLALVEQAEAIADGRATVRRPEPPVPDVITELLKGLTTPRPGAPDYFVRLLVLAGSEPVRAREELMQCEIVRDIFGDRERVRAFAPEWRTPDVTALAWHVYDTGDFSALPVLADALQDAGCDDADILDHCRGDPQNERGPHVRGCWAVDEVLELRSKPARLRSLVQLDPLTRVGTRPAFQSVLAEAVRRAVHTPLSLLHIDIDHFAEINRTFDHLVGDRTLTAFARFVGEVVEDVGLLARTTGDGFHVILPATDSGEARELAEHLRAEVAAWEGLNAAITISVGVATMRPGARDENGLQQAAAAALDEAKRGGRNRVCG